MNKKNLLFLIDIDGTLLSTQGKAPQIMIECIRRVTGISVPYQIEDFIGNLDPLILKKLLHRAGMHEHEMEHYLPLAMEEYIELIQSELSAEDILVFDGVTKFLESLWLQQIPYGLLTGNIKLGAMIKLKKAGLQKYFSIGAFADDGEKRSDLVPIAIRRAEKFYQRKFPPDRVWVVGDSPNDILCAHENRCNSLIVLTGKSTRSSLEKYHPTMILERLTAIEEILPEIHSL